MWHIFHFINSEPNEYRQKIRYLWNEVEIGNYLLRLSRFVHVFSWIFKPFVQIMSHLFWMIREWRLSACDLRFEIQLNNIQAVFKDLKSVANLIQLWSDKASEQTVR